MHGTRAKTKNKRCSLTRFAEQKIFRKRACMFDTLIKYAHCPEAAGQPQHEAK
jgi:hypothetical protein